MKNKSFLQFVKFVLVGISNTLISEGIYVILIYFNFHYIAASFIGFAISVLNAFYWSNKYVFRENPGQKRTWWKVLIKTYIAYGFGFLVSAALLYLWVDIIDISRFLYDLSDFTIKINKGFDNKFVGEAVAALINLCITVPLNFFTNKLWAYRAENTTRSNENDT